MDEIERRAVVLHPPHRWRGIGIDRSGRWPVVTAGFFTFEVVAIGRRLVRLLANLRRKAG